MWKSGLALQTTDYSMRRLFVGLFQIIYCPAHLTDCCRDECVDQSGTWSDICSFPLSRITRWNHIFFYNIRRPVVLLLLLEFPRWLRAWKGGNVFTHLVRKKLNICSLVVWEAFDGLIQFATGIIGIQWNQHELKLTTLIVLIKRLTKRDEFFKGKWFRQEYQLNVCADVFRVPVSLIAVAVSQLCRYEEANEFTTRLYGCDPGGASRRFPPSSQHSCHWSLSSLPWCQPLHSPSSGPGDAAPPLWRSRSDNRTSEWTNPFLFDPYI